MTSSAIDEFPELARQRRFEWDKLIVFCLDVFERPGTHVFLAVNNWTGDPCREISSDEFRETVLPAFRERRDRGEPYPKSGALGSCLQVRMPESFYDEVVGKLH